MAAQTMSNIKVETEGDLQIVHFTLSTVSNNDTVDVSNFTKNVVHFTLVPSTSAGVGYTKSGGVITLLISAGTPNLNCRLAGN